MFIRLHRRDAQFLAIGALFGAVLATGAAALAAGSLALRWGPAPYFQADTKTIDCGGVIPQSTASPYYTAALRLETAGLQSFPYPDGTFYYSSIGSLTVSANLVCQAIHVDNKQ